jgi:hypothetical protein
MLPDFERKSNQELAWTLQQVLVKNIETHQISALITKVPINFGRNEMKTLNI